MRSSFYYLVIFLVFMYGCKDKTNHENSSQPKQEINTEIPAVNKKLENPCELITKKQIAEIFGVKESIIEVKSDQYSSQFSRSCNFKWSDDQYKTEKGIMLLIQANPVPAEIKSWSQSYLKSQREDGPEDFGNKNPGRIKYRKFEGLDEDSAYSPELRHLYWRVDDNTIFGIFISDKISKKNLKDNFLKLFKIIKDKLE